MTEKPQQYLFSAIHRDVKISFEAITECLDPVRSSSKGRFTQKNSFTHSCCTVLRHFLHVVLCNIYVMIVCPSSWRSDINEYVYHNKGNTLRWRVMNVILWGFLGLLFTTVAVVCVIFTVSAREGFVGVVRRSHEQ